MLNTTVDEIKAGVNTMSTLALKLTLRSVEDTILFERDSKHRKKLKEIGFFITEELSSDKYNKHDFVSDNIYILKNNILLYLKEQGYDIKELKRYGDVDHTLYCAKFKLGNHEYKGNKAINIGVLGSKVYTYASLDLLIDQLKYLLEIYDIIRKADYMSSCEFRTKEYKFTTVSVSDNKVLNESEES